MIEIPKEAKAAARRFSAAMIAKGFNPEALHPYTYADGRIHYYRIRLKHPQTGDKWIRPMHLDVQGYELGEPTFVSGKPLYGLHRIASNPDAVVWITEGEQKADALNKLGLVATTSGAATSADTADWQPLRGRNCIIWRDYDDPGKSYAGEVASILLGLSCAVSSVDVDTLGLSDKGDVVDWLAAHPGAAGGDIEVLPMLAPSLAEKNVTARIVALDIGDLLMRDFPPMEALLTPWLCKQHLSMVHAWRGVGKTHFALGVAYAVAGGGQFLKWKEAPARCLHRR